MADLDLRPLSLGEILDRTFSLYRRNFVLFLGINALPQLLILALNIAQTLFVTNPAVVGRPPAGQLQSPAAAGLMAFGIVGVIVGVIVYFVSYLFAQGGTVYAVSELYLGRATTIGASLGRMRGQLGSLFGVLFLNGLAIMGGMLFLIIPGIYIACRLITCVPAALLEDLGPRASLERSFRLTKDNAGRAFVIYLLYFILLYAALFLFMLPFAFVAGLAAKDPSMMRVWLSVSQIGNFLAAIIVSPFLTIATAVFYYDLRVRKEAFDLQFMMNPSGTLPSGTAGVPHTLA
ncbi:MAG TPA: hypothetical protein VH110_08050 [Candidatus Acidoferrum sp.]|jgi:hypothetical protein|nr:hypothetical protein [Candidatus Acidoferrum sp.]